jgi:hypothetical protein
LKQLAIKYDYLILALVAFAYYFVLCSKEWTWIFTSGDSGDWLASSIWWVNSQPFGSPLFVLLGHLLNFIFPHHLVLAMTIGLSVIPASITVAVTYLIIKHMSNIKYAIAGTIILLGSVIFLTQSTILEEYALSTMFVTLAYYFYIQDKKKLTILMLALGSAIHVIVALISFIWLCFNLKNVKTWYKSFWIYVVFGILPYTLVFVLMAGDNPKILAGSLSMASINNYLGTTGTIGSISWYEAIFRVPQFAGFMCLTLGLGIIPFISMFKRFYTQYIGIALATCIFCMWLYLTNNDPNTWTFMCFAIPIMTVIVALGLSKLNSFHYKMVIACAIALIIFNSIFLNANVLSKQMPVAKNFETETFNLPDGSAIVNMMSGNYVLGIMYVMAQGKDIIPILFVGDIPNSEADPSVRYRNYEKWLNKQYDISGSTTQEQVSLALNRGIGVYVAKVVVTKDWDRLFEIKELPENKVFDQIVGVKQWKVKR